MAKIKDDFTSNVKTTGVLTLGSKGIGKIEVTNDIDWFKVHLIANENVRIDMEGSDTDKGSLPNPTLNGVYDSTGKLLDGTSDADSGIGDNSLMFFSPSTTGDYYVSAGGYGSYSYSKTTGTYEVTVAKVVDDFSADSKTSGRVTGRPVAGVIDSPTDSDWIAFTLEAGQKVTVKTVADIESEAGNGSSSSGFTTIVYDSNNKEVMNSDSWSSSYSSSVTSELGGTYYAAIALPNFSSDYYDYNNAYTLSIVNIVNGDLTSEKLSGTQLIDIVNAGSGNDTVSSLAGDDKLYGENGNDSLNGGDGDDLLNGGKGFDILTGGKGADIFQLSVPYSVDKITDFTSIDDTIQISHMAFTSLPYDELNPDSSLSVDNFIAGDGVVNSVGSNDYLIYNSTTGILYYDDDANGSNADPAKIAILGVKDHPQLTSEDFVVV